MAVLDLPVIGFAIPGFYTPVRVVAYLVFNLLAGIQVGFSLFPNCDGLLLVEYARHIAGF